MKKENYSLKYFANEKKSATQREFEDDIVFARFINYMKIALFHKKLDYNKHQDFLKRQEQNLNYEEWSVLSDKDSSVHSFFCFNADYNKLEIAIRKLTDKQRIIITNHFYKNQSLTAIAKDLNMTAEAVRQMKLRAMNRLKKILEDESYE